MQIVVTESVVYVIPIATVRALFVIYQDKLRMAHVVHRLRKTRVIRIANVLLFSYKMQERIQNQSKENLGTNKLIK
jgi:hypothetical protein